MKRNCLRKDLESKKIHVKSTSKLTKAEIHATILILNQTLIFDIVKIRQILMSCPKANSTTSKHITNFVSTFNAVNRVFTNIALSNTWKDTMRMQYTVKKIYPQMKRIPKTIRGYNWSNRCLHEHCHASHRNILLNISIVNQSNNSFSWIDASEQISTSTHQYSGYATILTRNFALVFHDNQTIGTGLLN